MKVGTVLAMAHWLSFDFRKPRKCCETATKTTRDESGDNGPYVQSRGCCRAPDAEEGTQDLTADTAAKGTGDRIPDGTRARVA